MNRRTSGPIFVLILILAALLPTGAQAQDLRIGVSVGGASSVALILEQRWEHQGIELQVGTWGFHDLSVSITGKQYAGSSAVEPFVGFGLWGLIAFSEEGRGYGIIARAPVGFDWNVSGDHTASLAIYLNRALALKRPDPEDKRPPRASIVPLPEFSYRWRNRDVPAIP